MKCTEKGNKNWSHIIQVIALIIEMVIKACFTVKQIADLSYMEYLDIFQCYITLESYSDQSKMTKQMPFLTVNGSLITLAVVQLYHVMNQLYKLKTVKFTMN